jgi:uncharacterized protein
MVSSLGKAITSYPTSFGIWGCLLQEIVEGTDEIAIVGDNFSAEHTRLLAEYIPHRVLMASSAADAGFPLLSDKPLALTTVIYLCRNYTCLNPVFSAKELILLINRAKNNN